MLDRPFRCMPMTAGLIWLAIGRIAFGSIYVAYAPGPWSELTAIGGSGLPLLIRSRKSGHCVCGRAIPKLFAATA